MRTLIALAFGLTLLVPASAPAAGRTLVATVGAHDAFTITLTQNGKRVHSLPAGTYTIVVHDLSKIHNFALGSVTKNKRIFTGSVAGVGTKRYTVKLIAGQYAYACSAHPTTMNGSFSVK